MAVGFFARSILTLDLVRLNDGGESGMIVIVDERRYEARRAGGQSGEQENGNMNGFTETHTFGIESALQARWGKNREGRKGVLEI